VRENDVGRVCVKDSVCVCVCVCLFFESSSFYSTPLIFPPTTQLFLKRRW